MYVPAWLIVALLLMPPIVRALDRIASPLLVRLATAALRPGASRPRPPQKSKRPSRWAPALRPLWLAAIGAAVIDMSSKEVAPLVVGFALAGLGVGWCLQLAIFPDKAPSRPSPASNWQPIEQEEAGAATSEWVAERLRRARRP